VGPPPGETAAPHREIFTDLDGKVPESGARCEWLDSHKNQLPARTEVTAKGGIEDEPCQTKGVRW